MNKYLFFALSVFAVLVTVNSSVLEDSEDAKLLVAKNILNNYIVEGLDVTIKYNIYNIGNVYVFFSPTSNATFSFYYNLIYYFQCCFGCQVKRRKLSKSWVRTYIRLWTCQMGKNPTTKQRNTHCCR